MGANLSVHIDHVVSSAPYKCILKRFLLSVKVEENTHVSFAQSSLFLVRVLLAQGKAGGSLLSY